jgi:hypothetical protein
MEEVDAWNAKLTTKLWFKKNMFLFIGTYIFLMIFIWILVIFSDEYKENGILYLISMLLAMNIIFGTLIFTYFRSFSPKYEMSVKMFQDRLEITENKTQFLRYSIKIHHGSEYVIMFNDIENLRFKPDNYLIIKTRNKINIKKMWMSGKILNSSIIKKNKFEILGTKNNLLSAEALIRKKLVQS